MSCNVSKNSLMELLQQKILEDNQDYLSNKTEETSYSDLRSLINLVSTHSISQGKHDLNTILFILNKQVTNLNEDLYDDICISYFCKLSDLYKVNC